MASTSKSRVAGVPSKDLEVEEATFTSAVLHGAALYYHNYCEKPNDEFMDCRIDSKDPRKCLKEGHKVTECAVKFFKKVKDSCNESFTEYWTCLDYNNQDYAKCRKPQESFDTCMLDKLDLKRAETVNEGR